MYGSPIDTSTLGLDPCGLARSPESEITLFDWPMGQHDPKAASNCQQALIKCRQQYSSRVVAVNVTSEMCHTQTRASTTRVHKGAQQSEVSKLCHRGNLTKPLYRRTCRTVTLLATLAGQAPHGRIWTETAPWPDPGARTGIP
jgi:hypothetical protein